MTSFQLQRHYQRGARRTPPDLEAFLSGLFNTLCWIIISLVLLIMFL